MRLQSPGSDSVARKRRAEYCHHRYRIGENGAITDAKIVPPTSQNQRSMELDLRDLVVKNITMPKEQMTLLCEQSVRNYDPCISCATHFIRMEVEK